MDGGITQEIITEYDVRRGVSDIETQIGRGAMDIKDAIRETSGRIPRRYSRRRINRNGIRSSPEEAAKVVLLMELEGKTTNIVAMC